MMQHSAAGPSRRCHCSSWHSNLISLQANMRLEALQTMSGRRTMAGKHDDDTHHEGQRRQWAIAVTCGQAVRLLPLPVQLPVQKQLHLR